MLLTYDVSQAITLDSYPKSPNLTSSFKLIDHWWGVVYQLVRDMLPVSILYKSYVRSRFGISHWRCGILNFTCVVIEAGEPYQLNKCSNYLRLFEFRTSVFLFSFALLFYSCLYVFSHNFTCPFRLSLDVSLHFDLPSRIVVRCFPSFWSAQSDCRSVFPFILVCPVGLSFDVSFHFDLPSRIEIQCFPSF